MEVDLNLLRILLFGIKERKEKEKRKEKNQTNKLKINLSKYLGILKTGFHGQGLGLLPIKLAMSMSVQLARLISR